MSAKEDERAAGLHEAVTSWIAAHADEMGSTQLQLSGVSGSSLLLQANSDRIHLIFPSSDGEGFLVTAADVNPNPNPSFHAALLALNEKFERLGLQSDDLFIAMEHLLTTLKKLKAGVTSEAGGSALRSDYESGYDDDDNDSDEEINHYLRSDEVDFGYDMASFEDACNSSSAFMELRYKGFLYAMAEEANHRCQEARRKLRNPSTSSDTLAWCIVKPDPDNFLIHIQMQIGGFMYDDATAASLGISLDCLLIISLELDRDLWCKKQHTSSLKIDSCSVKTLPAHNKVSKGKRAIEMDNVDTNECREKDQRHKFGEVLVPELVSCFFRYLGSKDEMIAKSADVLKELQNFIAMSNPILGLINFLAARFKALPNWCIACWDTLPYKVGRLRTCEKDLCLYRFEELGLGVAILQEVHKSCELIDFEISLAITAVASERDVFEPFPAFLLEKEEIRDRSGWFSKKCKPDPTKKRPYDKNQSSKNSNKNFSVLKSVLYSFASLKEMEFFHDEQQLKEALEDMWHKTLDQQKLQVHELWRQKAGLPYDVLRFLISSNRLTMCCLKGSEQLPIRDAIYQFVVLHDSPEKEAQFEKRRAEKGGSFFAFHGSPAGNWFSILRNGLRSMSNTHFMSTGAAHGAGIYTASELAISIGYAVSGSGWKHGKMHSPFRVLAICEIVNGSLATTGYFSNGIMVVRPDCEQDILIRYILVLPESRAHYSLQIQQQTRLTTGEGKQIDLSDYHNKLRERYYTNQQKEWREVRKERWVSLLSMCKKDEAGKKGSQTTFHAANIDKEHSHSSILPACMQAVQKELKNISVQINAAKKKKLQKDDASPILALIKIEVPDETNLLRWHVDLSQDLFKDSLLYEDLARRAKQNKRQSTSIKLECTFPDSFPMAPPFIRVMYPRFKFHTGHVTVGGSICMELLTESGWSPAFCFESVLVQIASAMMEGGARLDFTSPKSEYSISEAREAFDRVAREHGWIKRLSR